MNSMLYLFLSLSLSGTILALVLMVLRLFGKNRLSQTWQYYIWVVVILRFLLPLTPQVSIAGAAVQRIHNAVYGPAVITNSREINAGNEGSVIPQALNDPALQPDETGYPASALSNSWHEGLSYAWLLWLGIALVLFVHKLASYRSFARFVKVGAKKMTDIRVLDIYSKVLDETKIKTRLPLYHNEQVSSPMLVGIVRPMIILPPMDADDEILRSIFRHELTHFRRLDFIYKWLVQITVCLHWFNPLVYVISKQISQCCELSCDESVIKQLDEEGRMIYGDALIASLEAQGSYSDFVVSITMSEQANLVKERLDVIMKYRKHKKWNVVLSVILAGILSVGGYTLGAYPASITAYADSTDHIGGADMTGSDITDPDGKGTVVINLRNKAGETKLLQSSDFEASAGQILTLEIKSTIKGAVDLFLFSPSHEEQRITMVGNDDIQTIVLSEGRWSYNCTGFFDSGDISIVGTLFDGTPVGAGEAPTIQRMTDSELKTTQPEDTAKSNTEPDPNGGVVLNLSNDKGQKSLLHSSSFEAGAGQVLTLESKSTIEGTVDLFLFSTDNQQQRITFGGSDEIKSITLSEGRWSYNCTGFFDSGEISIIGTVK